MSITLFRRLTQYKALVKIGLICIAVAMVLGIFSLDLVADYAADTAWLFLFAGAVCAGVENIRSPEKPHA